MTLPGQTSVFHAFDGAFDRGIAAGRERARPLALAAVCTLALAAPFELHRPLVVLPWNSISNVEAMLVAAFAGWGAALVSDRVWPRWRTPVTVAWSVWLAWAALAAVTAGVARTNAIHMTARMVIALGVCLLAFNAAADRRSVRVAMTAIVCSASVVAVLIVLDYRQVPAVLALLRYFRAGVAVVGGQVRASGPLQYPTIASMVLEIGFACGLGLLMTALDRRSHGMSIAMCAVLMLMTQAIAFTFTRSGLVTAMAALAIVSMARWRRGVAPARVGVLVGLAAVIVAQTLASRSAESMRLRMTTEGQDAWYRVDVSAPPALSFATGDVATVPVTLTNTGLVTWDPNDDPPIRLSYHWLLADSDRVVSYEGLRTVFPHPIASGERIDLQARIHAPQQPGHYRLMWDLVEEGRLWFSTEPDAPMALSTAVVSGPARAPAPALLALPRATKRPGRLKLWRGAVRMLEAHPWLGVGPDNYRLVYASYTGLPAGDPRIHSNNMFLEVAAGTGLPGAAAFLVLVVAGGLAAVRASRQAGALGTALAAALFAIAAHGLTDSFLSFTPTYLLIALTLGLAAGCAWGMDPDADRV